MVSQVDTIAGSGDSSAQYPPSVCRSTLAVPPSTVSLRAPDSWGRPSRSASSAGITLSWASVASAPHSTRSYSSCDSAAAITADVCTAHEPWMAGSDTCTALSAPIDSALRIASVAVSGPTVRMVTSPPWASLTVSASSMAYSSISLITLSAVARATVLSDGSSFRSLPESGTCLTRTTMFIVRPTSAVVHGGTGEARLAADHRGYFRVTPDGQGGYPVTPVTHPASQAPVRANSSSV